MSESDKVRKVDILGHPVIWHVHDGQQGYRLVGIHFQIQHPLRVLKPVAIKPLTIKNEVSTHIN
jgi:hypothetical protein